LKYEVSNIIFSPPCSLPAVAERGWVVVYNADLWAESKGRLPSSNPEVYDVNSDCE